MSELNNRDYLLIKAYQSGITDSRELAAFMGQMQIESGDFARMHENLNYKPDRLLKVFPGRNGIDTEAKAKSIISEGPEAIANAIYGGDWGKDNLGNTAPGDGWRFHGRGYVQLTGRENYAHAEREIGLNLTRNPDLAADRDNAVNIALHYWSSRVVSRGHQFDVREATFDINGGYKHLAERKAVVASWERMLTPEVMEHLSKGKVSLPTIHDQQIASDLTIEKIQKNLNTLGIHDARGHELIVDGHRSGHNSHTNEAISAFRQRYGIEGRLTNAELLTATQVALNAHHATILDHSLPGIPAATHSQSATRHDNPVVGGPTTGHVPLTPPTAKPPHLPLTTTQPLEPGDRGAAVQALQQHLQTIGATDRDGNAIKDDRHYGPRTQQAVENFQRWAGREASGIADPGTLEALQTHAQFATRQKAQDLAPGRHLADHAQPASSHLTDALTERPAPPRPDLATAQQQAAPKALEPYSSPNSPLHALYAHTKTTLEGKDVPMSEERLHQVVGKMALYDMSPGGNNQFAVKGDTLYVIDLDACYNRFSLDLREPAPSMQATLQHVQTQQQTLEAELSSMREPPSYSR
ncbi:peptidoglycan-binding protein [Xanthomonas fragariae]|uniref:peptidoglycan-binding protein n=1 Tax=Xanthomonas fragariae TaxID=48664 RepID=UPI0022AB14A7|nr:peptidoglycan-binding protein [Xanthomonas fragariae]WAT15226.1 peptidoglycan-binding protein [Xanthomonas fragariae]